MTILVAINNSLNCHELWSQKSKVGGVKDKNVSIKVCLFFLFIPSIFFSIFFLAYHLV